MGFRVWKMGKAYPNYIICIYIYYICIYHIYIYICMCLFVYVYVICGQKIVVHGHPSHCGNPFAGYITHHKSL